MRRPAVHKATGLRRLAALLLALLLLTPLVSGAAAYPNNSISLRGLSLRAFDPPGADSWIMVIPVSTRLPARLQVDLIAGNCRVVGTAEITVSPGSLRVSSQYVKGLVLHEESLLVGSQPSDFDGLQQGAVTAYPLDTEIALEAGLGEAPLGYLCLVGRVSFDDSLPGVAPYGALTRANVQRRLALAEQFGLEEVYKELLPPVAAQPQPGEPDENGCIDGVCPVTLPFPKP